MAFEELLCGSREIGEGYPVIMSDGEVCVCVCVSVCVRVCV